MSDGRAADWQSERGETLLELLISITILGVSVVAIAASIGLSVRISDIHRKQATASAYARSYGESIENTVATSAWQGCSATPATYQSPAGFVLPVGGGYAATVAQVAYWNGTTFGTTCASDKGLQRLKLTVASIDDRASEQLYVIIRNPCVTAC
jgi:Tfp pilus assembly protein PilV